VPLPGSTPLPASVAHTLQQVDEGSLGGRCQIRRRTAGERVVYSPATDRFDLVATPLFGEAQAVIQRWAATVPVAVDEVQVGDLFTVVASDDTNLDDLAGRTFRVAEADSFATVLSGRLLILDENATGEETADV
jgi:hypothetical protein